MTTTTQTTMGPEAGITAAGITVGASTVTARTAAASTTTELRGPEGFYY
jgi:hypothetical protein